MNERTTALGITIAVKEAVSERDSFDGHPCCILCGSPAPVNDRLAFSNAHYISRSQGGLGVVENIVTLCPNCHRRYDQTTDRPVLREYFKEYLRSKHEGWDESKLYYRKV